MRQDQLCVWKPGQYQLDQLQIRYTYVSTEGPAYKEHFGTKEQRPTGLATRPSHCNKSLPLKGLMLQFGR